jgi:hypothetical protein
MTTTINRYSVGLSLDASDYIDKSRISAREAAKLNRAIEAGRSPAEKYSRGLDLLNKALNEGAIQLPVYNRLQDELARKHKVGAHSAEELAKSQKNVMGSVLSLTAAAATAAAAFAVTVRAVRSGIDTLRDAQAEIDKTAKSAAKLGMSFNELSGITFAAAEIGGIDAGQVESAIKQLLVRTSKAVGGDKTISEAFSRIGVDAGKAMAAGPVESIKMIAAGMEKLPTQAERLEVAMVLFGKSGADIVTTLTSGADVLEESIAFQEKWNGLTEAQVLGVEAANDAWGRVSFVVDGLTNKLAAEMAPLFGMMADDILGAADGFDQVDAAISRATDSMAILYGFTFDLITATESWGSVISRIAGGDFVGAGVSAGVAVQDAGKAGADALAELYRRRAELQKQADSKDSDAARLAAIKEQTDEVKSQGEAYTQLDAHVDSYHKRMQSIQDSFDKQMNSLEIQIVSIEQGADAAERMKLASEGLNQSQIDSLMTQRELVASMQDFAKESENAVKAAKKHFEVEREREKKIREGMAKGPGSGMESGSSDAAKFMADQVNARIAAVAMPERKDPTEKEILREAQKQYDEAVKQSAIQARQEKIMADTLAAIKENKFTRFR